MDLVEKIRESVIGKDTAVQTPFGLRRVTYADYTASGRSLTFIEDYIRSQVLPLYANTHTETSGTGLQTTRFREEAREIIRNAVGATKNEHAVIFAGSGMTGAIDKLITMLEIRLPRSLDDAHHLTDQIPPDQRPVVFVGPYEHHSNELPWRESIADVIEITEDLDGQINLIELGSAARRIRRSSNEDRIILGGLERDRDHLGHEGDLRAASSPQRSLVLGLRRLGPIRGHRNEVSCQARKRRLQGRHSALAPQADRRPRHPRCPDSPQGAFAPILSPPSPEGGQSSM